MGIKNTVIIVICSIVFILGIYFYFVITDSNQDIEFTEFEPIEFPDDGVADGGNFTEFEPVEVPIDNRSEGDFNFTEFEPVELPEN